MTLDQNDPAQMARFLVLCGAPPHEVESFVAESFPDENATHITAEAVRHAAVCEQQNDDALQAQADAARAAEHDLSLTMHTEIR